MKSAVLLIIYKREETTREVFKRIREAAPPRLYIAANAPNPQKADDDIKCQKARAITEQVDWDCSVKRLYRTKHLNAGESISSSISWFFQNETEGIILEDDILPHIDFFSYCDELLEKYRYDERIQLITGRNYLYEGYNSTYSYFMSSLFHIWGWASWRRVWESYEFDTAKLSKENFINSLSKRIPKASVKRWSKIFDMMSSHKNDTWDYQLYFNQILHNRYSVVSYVNMIENIGVNKDSTHEFSGTDKRLICLQGASPYPLKHPVEISEDKIADRIMLKNSGFYEPTIIKRIVNKLISLKKNE